MANQNEHIHQLFQRYVDNKASDEQLQELLHFLKDPATEASSKELFFQVIQNTSANTTEQQANSFESAWQNMLQANHSLNTQWQKQQLRSKLIIFKWRYIAAAILILAIGSGVYYFSNQSSTSNAIKGGTGETRGTKEDVAPGTNRAILTLSNGIQKQLSLADNGLHLQSDALLLTTPNGGQYNAVLPDGSKVWLNAASSIKFPSKFDKERRVEITGEVYFEIAKDKSKPFFVQTTKNTITVLGTAFNVNSYADEPNAKTSLMEGSIKINGKILTPGEAYQNGVIIKTNLEQDIAWKNGAFDFNNTDFETALRQISRWYDVTIKYETKVPSKELSGRMGRDLTLAQVLEGLNGLGIQSRLENKTLFILPSANN